MFTRALGVISYLSALVLAAFASLVAAGGSGPVVPAIIGTSLVILILMVISTRLAGTLRHQWPAVVLVALAAMGLAVAGLITSLTVDTSQKGGLVERICGPEGQVNRCRQVFQSRWARLPLGFGSKARRIPTVVVGVAYYTALLVWFVAIGRSAPEERWWHLVPLCLTAAGAAMGVFLTVIMYTRLAAPCPLCLASHVVTGLLFVVTALAWPRRRRAAPVPKTSGAAMSPGPIPQQAERMTDTDTPTPGIGPWQRPVMAIVLAGVVALLGIQFRGIRAVQATSAQYAKAYSQIANDPDYMRWDLDRQPVVPWAVRPDDSVRGPESAPFVVITYSDFQCPRCRALADMLNEVRREFPTRIRLVYRHFPLDRSCNPLTSTYMHAFSCQAARAAEAARRLGGDRAFWRMHDALFAHQAELNAQPFAKLAEQIGLDAKRFLAEMDDPRTRQRIEAHLEGSKRFKVTSTPVVFLNGRRVRQWNATTFWQAILAEPASRPTSTTAASRPATRAAR